MSRDARKWAHANAPQVAADKPPAVYQSCDLRTVVLSRRLRGQLISLDLTDNRLGSEAIDSIAPNYLRRLVLAGNIARDIPSLASFQQLVDLDLSLYERSARCLYRNLSALPDFLLAVIPLRWLDKVHSVSLPAD